MISKDKLQKYFNRTGREIVFKTCPHLHLKSTGWRMKLTDFPSVVTEYYTYLEGKEPYSSLKNLANCLGDIPTL